LSLLGDETLTELYKGFEECLQFSDRCREFDKPFKLFCNPFECVKVVGIGCRYNVAEQDKERCQWMIQYSPELVNHLCKVKSSSVSAYQCMYAT
jgi:hypothetical protein